jgi:DcuC family C4-dicarboxylate transporter
MSPIAAVIIACAGIAKISPFTVVKRTSVPMIGSLLVLVIIHTLRTMGG